MGGFNSKPDLPLENRAVREWENNTAEMVIKHAAIAPTFSTISNITGAFADRFVTIWLSNEDYAAVAHTIEWQDLALQGLLYSRYFALGHPGLANTVGFLGGEARTVADGEPLYVKSKHLNIIDRLEEKDISWGGYFEGLPFSGFQGDWYTPHRNVSGDDFLPPAYYQRKFNPFMGYQSILGDARRRGHVKNFTMLFDDTMHGTLPQFVYITPDTLHSGSDHHCKDRHDCRSARESARWATKFLHNMLRNPNFNNNRTLIFLTFDEAEGKRNWQHGHDRHVFTLALGGMLPDYLKGKVTEQESGHLSLLKTLEMNWGIDALTKEDRFAPSMWPLIEGRETATTCMPSNKTCGAGHVGFGQPLYPG